MGRVIKKIRLVLANIVSVSLLLFFWPMIVIIMLCPGCERFIASLQPIIDKIEGK